MPKFRLIAQDQYGQNVENICEVYDQIIDEQDYLQIFTYYGPVSGKKFHVHLVRHSSSIKDTAAAVFNGMTSIRSAKGLLEDLEEYAREMKWYDASKYTSFEQHAGKVGAIIGSVALLHKFLHDHAFSKQGYYNGRGQLVIPYVINTNDNTMYAP